MDLSYLVCSTLRCETTAEDFSSSAIDGFGLVDDGTITTTTGNKLDQSSLGVVESSCSENSIQSSSDQQQRQQSSSSLDASSNSRSVTLLQSGHTSPSSLALQRRPPQALKTVYLKQTTLSTDSTTASGDNSSSGNSGCSSTASNSNANDSTMAIACTATARAAAANNKTSKSGSSFRGVSSPSTSNTTLENEHKKKSMAMAAEFQEFCYNPPALRPNAWSEPSAGEYMVRSKSYLENNVKERSQTSAFHLITVDLVNTETPIYTGMCAHPGERIQLALERERQTGVKELPEFVFAVNLCIPARSVYHAVFYYGIDKQTMDEIKHHRSTAFGRIMNKFLFGDSDNYRDQTFKLIPRIVEGNYVVRKGVGSKPAILGKKINQRYVHDDRFFEIIVDIASDAVAKRITKLCLGYIKSIVVDMMFALEGYDEDTLPERIFGGATIKNLDFAKMDGKRTVRR
eukprot:CAMPEP_0201133612 /NCGR_PEP_ID=MMETSP0850-20130426/49337_1 /ASSEMBLY_ACC=CAM_ASM_000622 /TAXON_ID=183588 /ORGANISM="Pseudo-nitzschia fraudulenta, Strain WWA7" /LENGTH=457 /DNA_ID=CAMNT_0047404307 /DNA_START=14 /DNA_END=1387 /DNA_ORIENTATION=+